MDSRPQPGHKSLLPPNPKELYKGVTTHTHDHQIANSGAFSSAAGFSEACCAASCINAILYMSSIGCTGQSVQFHTKRTGKAPNQEARTCCSAASSANFGMNVLPDRLCRCKQPVNALLSCTARTTTSASFKPFSKSQNNAAPAALISKTSSSTFSARLPKLQHSRWYDTDCLAYYIRHPPKLVRMAD